MDVSKIKLIIWDLDDTLWNGTLSEGEVTPNEKARSLVLLCVKKGIINSICSKNDEKPCMDKLSEWGIVDYFVFNSINWLPKGERIKDMISAMNLRAVNVLFIDDNPQNLREAAYYNEGIMTALPDEIENLHREIEKLDKSDPNMSRLESYKVLEKKRRVQESIGSNEEFLRQSGIQAQLHTDRADCMEKLDRLHELMMRTNQLNFTKNRQSKEELAALISDSGTDSGYVTAADKYGDYGIVGFYAVKDNKAEHFLFSCRTLGMGIEQYTYELLGFPEIDVQGSVSVKIGADEPRVTWINNGGGEGVSEFVDAQKADFKVLIKGPCDLNQIFSFIKNEDMFDCEFTYVSRERQSYGVSIEGMNHTEQIREAFSLTDEQIKELCALPVCDSVMFPRSIYENRYGMVFVSILTDANLGLYRKKDGGQVFAFGEYIFPLTDEKMWDKYINGEVYTANCKFTRDQLRKISEEYEFIGRTTPERTAENLRFVYDHMKSGTELVILLGCEREYKYNKLEAWIDRHNDHKKWNEAVRRTFDGVSNVTLFDVNEYITSDDDFNDSINHYKKRVYYLMAQRFADMINARSDSNAVRSASKAKLAYQTVKQKLKKIIKPNG